MATNRKRVTVCTQDDAIAGALRIVLGEHEVAAVSRLEDIVVEPHALVYRVDGAFDGEALEDLALRVPTVVLGESEHLVAAVDANCRGFLLKDAPLEEIASAVATVLDGGAVVPPDLLGPLLHHLVVRRRREQDGMSGLAELTAREREVFRLAAAGLRKEEIGERLYISPATARTHLQRVYRKLGVHSQSELMAMAMRIGGFGSEGAR